jgi:hypothetical protein
MSYFFICKRNFSWKIKQFIKFVKNKNMKSLFILNLILLIWAPILLGQYDSEKSQLVEISQKMTYKLDGPKRIETVKFSIEGENLIINTSKKFLEMDYHLVETTILPIKNIKTLEIDNRKVNRNDFPYGFGSLNISSLRNNTKAFKVINQSKDTSLTGFVIVSIPDDRDIESFIKIKSTLDPILLNLVDDCTKMDTMEIFSGEPLIGGINDYLEHKITMDNYNEGDYLPILNDEIVKKFGEEKSSSIKYQNLMVIFIVNEKDEVTNLTTIFTDIYNNCDKLSEGCEFFPTVSEYKDMSPELRKAMDDLLGLLPVEDNIILKNIIKSHKWKSGKCNGKKIPTRIELTLNPGVIQK